MRRIDLLTFGLLLFACKKEPFAKIEALRDALAAGDAKATASATEDFPRCSDPGGKPTDEGCLKELAAAFGSKAGFSSKSPNQAAVAAVALVLTRDGHGDWIPNADTWLGSIRSGSGAGPDALRLATMRRMVDAAPLVGKKLEDEKDARAMMRAVAGAIPGACPTYAMLGNGIEEAKLAAELSPDHSACVQKDLSRRDGPGGSYGEGVWRAAMGASTLWREAARALRLGLSSADAKTKAALEAKLTDLDAASTKLDVKRVEADRSALGYIGDVHADAGYVLWKTDAGADGGDAGDAAARPGDAGPRR